MGRRDSRRRLARRGRAALERGPDRGRIACCFLSQIFQDGQCVRAFCAPILGMLQEMFSSFDSSLPEQGNMIQIQSWIISPIQSDSCIFIYFIQVKSLCRPTIEVSVGGSSNIGLVFDVTRRFFIFHLSFSAGIALCVRHFDFVAEITESVCGNFVHQAEITLISFVRKCLIKSECMEP